MDLSIRHLDGTPAIARFRRARPNDVPAIEQLIAASARGLSRGDYTDAQVEAALGNALGVDSQLIRDGTYFVAEADGALVASGGWSHRKTLFGGDRDSGRQPEVLDPRHEAARIRAFFVHPDYARQGLGKALLALCESAAESCGFTAAELMATLPGVRLYGACGYESRAPVDHTLPNGTTIRFVPMQKRLQRAARQLGRRRRAVRLAALRRRGQVRSEDLMTADSLSALVARGLAGQFTRVRDKIHTLVDPLTTDELWSRPYPYGNSIGHLLLHLTGNLNYYVGAQIAGTGYIRDRPREFADTSRRSTSDVLADFDRAVDVVLAALAAQGHDDWAAAFSGVGAEDLNDRFAMFLRCAAHADHHHGQIIYLRKQLRLE